MGIKMNDLILCIFTDHPNSKASIEGKRDADRIIGCPVK